MIEPEGKFIGKYRILARVGQGGMGTVYKAYQPGLERFVAIKTLRHEYGREEEAAALFKKEARAIARLRHKNILQIYDFDVADDVMYMVTEFVEGMTLAEYLQMDDEQMPQSLLDSGQATPVLFEQLPQVKVDIPQLHHILDNRFNEGELRNLCLYLDIDYEDLPGQAQADKARELILYLERRHNFARLLTEGKRYRPDIEWNKAITLVLPVDKPPPEKGADSSVFGISKNLIEIFMTLAEAVGYAHSQNVVHHDLKPGNVIITPEGRIVLMDFGLAQILDATMKSKDDMVMGTPLYISPEQCQGQRGDKRSDIYSLGVILYEMVTGQVPFNARNYAAIIMKHIMEPPPPPRIYRPEIPPLVESVILRALRKDADGRFQSAEEMVVALNQAMATVTPGVVTESDMVRRPSEPGKPVSTPFQIPPAIYQFVGRKALLQEIETAVRKPTGSHIICLHGMAGVGKTATAVQIAYLMRQDFPDGVLWANIASSDPMSILDNWARAFGHNYTSLPDLENRAAAMRNALRDKKLLIILDDVDSKKQVDSLLPNNPGIAVILTTRLAELGPAVGAASFLITEMTPEDGRQLFAVIVGEGRVAAEPEAAAEICELVGYLPLAVKISGQRLVSRPRWALTAFANRLKNARSRLSELNILDEGVQASFDVSWELLTDELRLAFADLAVFGARPFPIPAFAAVTGTDEFTAGDRLDALVALSLLQEADRDIYRQHPLLADFSQNKLQDTGTFSRMVRYFLKFAQSHQKDYAALEARWDNIHYGLQIARQESDWQSVMAYADALADAWFALGRFDEARQGFGGAVAAAEAVDDQLAVGNYLYLNGRVCARQHDYDTARANLEQSLNIHRALQNRPLEANDLFLLARIAMETGDYESALNLLAECRAIRQDERDELGLAETTFLEARIAFFRGDYEQCVALAQETIAPFRKFDNQSGLIRLLNVLASAEIEQKRFSQAEIHAREGLAFADALQDKPEKAMMLYVLSNVARHQNDLTNAEVLIQESIALLQNMGDLVSLAGTLYQLSIVQEEKNQLQLALETAQQSLKLTQEIDFRLLEAYVLIHLGDLHLVISNRKIAQGYWDDALSIGEELNHPTVIENVQRRLVEA